MATSFKPSEVVLRLLPLIETIGKTEAEFAAAMIVRTCQVEGDYWQPVEPKTIERVIKGDLDLKCEPFYSNRGNPFLRPNIWELVKRGFARWTDEPGKTVEFTDDGIQALTCWIKPPIVTGS